MPVSTTHSIVGAIVGMTIAVKDSDCVTWYKKKDDFPYVGGVSGIVLSWVVAPLLSYGFAMILFLLVRTFILRQKNSYERAFYLYPILFFVTTFVLTLFIIYKGAKGKGLADELGDTEEEQDGYITLIAVIFAIISTLFVTLVGLNKLREWIDEEFKTGTSNRDEKKTNEAKGADIELGDVKLGNKKNGEITPKGGPSNSKTSFMASADRIIEKMTEDVFTLDDATKKVHENAEVFDEKTEAFFRYVQIFTVCCDSFAHGANDVANSVGPFAAVYIIYKTHVVVEDSDLGDDAFWILGFGGLGIVIGLAIYGYKIIQVLGNEMAKVTPSRGFAIELGAVAVIIMGTRLGIPLSTTHCQVGATCGVAHVEGRDGVNYRTLLVVIFGWIATLVVAGLTAGIFSALGAYSPSRWGPAYDGMAQPLGDLYLNATA